ncbi:MAG: DUF721 domain-containing protein [Candidatus Sabulitectum sp.]|nr:DUF721 domain-containing protein [Candidatus Sabulitectum sp.]
MESVRSLVEKLWSRHELDKVSSRNRALEAWNGAVGEKISEMCSLEGFSESTVNVRAFNPAAAMELRYSSSRIINTLNESAGAELFVFLRITLRPTTDGER